MTALPAPMSHTLFFVDATQALPMLMHLVGGVTAFLS
jgi:hypothetical protein